MREASLRSLIDAAVAREGTRLSVATRRHLLELDETHDVGIWVCCECCGETSEEALAIYLVRRVTRLREGACLCLCGACALRRVPCDRVVSS